MKAVNIIGIVMSVGLMIVSIYYYNEAYDAYRDMLWSSLDYGYGGYSYGPSRAEITQEGGLITLIFMLFFVFLPIMNIAKVKTMTAKVMGIIGVSLAGICLLLNLLMVADPGGASYDEMGPLFTIFGFIMIAFTIVLLVQSVKADKGGSQVQIDDIE